MKVNFLMSLEIFTLFLLIFLNIFNEKIKFEFKYFNPEKDFWYVVSGGDQLHVFSLEVISGESENERKIRKIKFSLKQLEKFKVVIF